MTAAEIKTKDASVGKLVISGMPTYMDNSGAFLRPLQVDAAASTNLLTRLSGKIDGTEPG